MYIKIDVDISKVVGWSRVMTDDTIRKAQVSTVNKLGALAETAMRREITREFNVSASFVRARLRLRRASNRGGSGIAIEAVLIGSGSSGAKRSANLIHFVEKSISLAEARRRLRAGEGQSSRNRTFELRAKIKRGAGPKIVKGAFIGNKGRTVFIREGNTRLPIKPVQTIDVPQMFNTKRVNGRVVALIESRGKQQLEHELRYYMSRQG